MTNRPTVIVTGSSGLVGSGLVSYLSRRGFAVRAFQRKIPEHPNPAVSYVPFNLENVQDVGFAGADYIVHCAYRPVVSSRERKSGRSIDIEATKRLIAIARRHNIRFIFLSTTSAHGESRSYYAKNKMLAESLFDMREDLVLKLGLVLGGNGGLFGKIKKMLRQHRVIPLISAGRQRVQIIALDDLCRVIEVGINQKIAGAYRIAHPFGISMKELYRGVARRLGVNPFFIPVPWLAAYILTKTAEGIRIKLPFTSQNILGLKDLRIVDTTSSLEAFGLEIEDCQTALSRLHFEQ